MCLNLLVLEGLHNEDPVAHTSISTHPNEQADFLNTTHFHIENGTLQIPRKYENNATKIRKNGS